MALIFKLKIGTRKAFGAISLLWLSTLGGAAFAFLSQIILARELTPVGYGLFSAALATTTLVAPLAGFGVQGLWLKLFGAEGWGATRWLSASFRFTLISATFVLISLAAWATWGPHDAATQQLLYWLLPVVSGTMFMELVSGKLQLEERYNVLALWQLLPNATRLLFIILVVAVSSRINVDRIAAAYALAATIVIVLGSAHLRTMFQGRFSLKGHNKLTVYDALVIKPRPITMFDFARAAWPFGFAGLFYLVYYQSDIILLKYLSGSDAAGIYNVAFTIMGAVYILPNVIYQRFLLPKYHRWANHDRSRFLQVYRIGNGSMLLIGGVTTGVMLLIVPFLIPTLFGTAYKSAIGLLSILAFCAPVRFLSTSVGATLVTQEHMRRKIFYMGSVALVNLALNLLLIPLYAAIGAAISTLISEIALLAFYLIAVRRHVFGPEAWRGWAVT